MTTVEERTLFQRWRAFCRRNLIFLKLHYFFFFAGQAILLPFIPMLQKQHGLTEKETSVINGTLPFLGFFAVYGISRLTDKLRRHKMMLVSLCIVCAMAHLCLVFIPKDEPVWKSSDAVLQCDGPRSQVNVTQQERLLSLFDESVEVLSCEMDCFVDKARLHNSRENVGKELNETMLHLKTHFIRKHKLVVDSNWTSEGQYNEEYENLIHNIDYEEAVYDKMICDSKANLQCKLKCFAPAQSSETSEFGSKTFIYFIVIYFVAQLFYAPCTCVCDALTYKLLSSEHDSWGRQRCFGTIGFITASCANSLLKYLTADDGGNYDLNVYLFFALMTLSALAASLIPKSDNTDNNYDDRPRPATNGTSLLKDIRVWTLVTAMLLFGLNFGLVFAFLFWYMNDLPFEASFETQNTVMSLVLVVAGLMELVFMVISGYIVRKLGQIPCMVIAFVAYFLRMLMYSQLSALGSIWWTLGIELLYGPSFGLLFPAATSYANQISPPGMEATLQGLASGFHFNIGWGAGALIGGFVYEAIGGSRMFLSFGLLSLSAAVCLGLFHVFVLRKSQTISTGRVPAEELKSVNEKDGCTYIHALIMAAGKLEQSAGKVVSAIPVLYRLVIRGCDVNAQNHSGNTALHLSCFRPGAATFTQHLIRLGADPSIESQGECKVIHSPKERQCFIVKCQPLAKSGIWDAIRSENLALTTAYLKSWCRVNTYRKRRTLYSVADETGNNEMLRVLDRYRNTNELVMACLACDGPKVKEWLSLKSDKCNLSTRDESCEIPKPLVTEVRELLPYSADVIKLLLKHGVPDDQDYINEMNAAETAFETSLFYIKLNEGTLQSLTEALNLLTLGQVNIHARSQQNQTRGSTYLHHVVRLYLESEDTFVRRYLVRILYRLALDGIDVNARDGDGFTVLHRAFNEDDRRIIEHVIRIGVDSSITTPTGKTVTLEKYDHKGRFIFTCPQNRNDLPGLWPAVEDRNTKRLLRWLKSGCRVETVRSGRTLREVTKSLGFNDVLAVLEEYRQVNEFFCSTVSCDPHRMKHYLALGNGKSKVNFQDAYYHAGFTDTRCSEYVARPLITTAMEYCTPQVVDMMYQFGADFTVQYEECAPCGPTAFWGFRDDIDASVTSAVAKYADIDLRDERGHTMLHSAILKNDPDRIRIVEILLERGIHVGARDINGLTARDYCTMGVAKEVREDGTDLDKIRQTIDDYVLVCVSTGEIEVIDRLILDSYDHLLDIVGTVKRKTAKELAYLKEQKDIGELLDEVEEYEVLINKLHEACETGDIKTLTKLFQEKRAAWGRDKGGRNLLHKAVLFGQEEVVKCLIEQYPDLINGRDNLLRTPVHYACCLGDGKKVLQLINQAGMTNLMTTEANKMSSFDYVREMDQKETPTRAKPRGRRFYDYKVRQLVPDERTKQYGLAPDPDVTEGDVASGTNLVINSNSEIMARPSPRPDTAKQDSQEQLTE